MIEILFIVSISMIWSYSEPMIIFRELWLKKRLKGEWVDKLACLPCSSLYISIILVILMGFNPLIIPIPSAIGFIIDKIMN
jgi:hypothetical protein